MESFKLTTSTGTKIISENTKINGLLITRDIQLCEMIFLFWQKATNFKTFDDWAKDINDSKKYSELTFTKYHAVAGFDHLFNLEIDGKKIKSVAEYYFNTVIV